MSDWIKLGLTLAGFAVITWSMVQQHEYRITALQNSFDTHLTAHDAAIKEIGKTLHAIDLTLARMNSRDDLNR